MPAMQQDDGAPPDGLVQSLQRELEKTRALAHARRSRMLEQFATELEDQFGDTVVLDPIPQGGRTGLESLPGQRLVPVDQPRAETIPESCPPEFVEDDQIVLHFDVEPRLE